MTKNVQNIRQQPRFDDFVQELDHLEFDIAFITESWRSNVEESLRTPGGQMFFLSGGTTRKGVSICLSKHMWNNVDAVSFHAYSHRICSLHFTWMRKRFQVFAVYFPTSWDADSEVEQVYDVLELLLLACDHAGSIPIVGGDFNACLGSCLPADDIECLGRYGNGIRNPRGWMLARWILQRNLQILNRCLLTPQPFLHRSPLTIGHVAGKQIM